MASQNDGKPKIFSILGICESIAQLAATSLFNTVYNATLNFYHGFCFLMAAAIIGSNIIIASYLHFKLRKSENDKELETKVNTETAQTPESYSEHL